MSIAHYTAPCKHLKQAGADSFSIIPTHTHTETHTCTENYGQQKCTETVTFLSYTFIYLFLWKVYVLVCFLLKRLYFILIYYISCNLNTTFFKWFQCASTEHEIISSIKGRNGKNCGCEWYFELWIPMYLNDAIKDNIFSACIGNTLTLVICQHFNLFRLQERGTCGIGKQKTPKWLLKEIRKKSF